MALSGRKSLNLSHYSEFLWAQVYEAESSREALFYASSDKRYVGVVSKMLGSLQSVEDSRRTRIYPNSYMKLSVDPVELDVEK